MQIMRGAHFLSLSPSLHPKYNSYSCLMFFCNITLVLRYGKFTTNVTEGISRIRTTTCAHASKFQKLLKESRNILIYYSLKRCYLPYYRKLTLHEIKVMEINAKEINAI